MEKYIYAMLALSVLGNLVCMVCMFMAWRHVKYLKKELFAAVGSHIDTLKEHDRSLQGKTIVRNGQK